MIDKIKKSIGSKVRIGRGELNLTQEKLAFDIGMSVETISNIERGRVLPSIDTLLKISEKLKCSVGDFFMNIDDRKLSNRRIELETKVLQGIKDFNEIELEFIAKQIDSFKNYTKEVDRK